MVKVPRFLDNFKHEEDLMATDKVIGINGLGRMGKLILWQLIARGQQTVVVNVGREIGEKPSDLLEYLLYDSTFGSLKENLGGRFSMDDIDIQVDGFGRLYQIRGTRIFVLKKERNPKNIPWVEFDVKVVLEATGKFNYPERRSDQLEGSARGHFDSLSVEKVFITSPFKLSEGIPGDSIMMVNGVNDYLYDPKMHRIISNASCSTTCLAHLVNPWVKFLGAKKIKVISADIPHAKTNKEPSLDRLPLAGKGDPCTWRSSNENMFISSTGSAKALPIVIPELAETEFSAKSIREPSDTVSLVIATLVIDEAHHFTQEKIGEIYQKYGGNFVSWSLERNFSKKFLGSNQATIVDGLNCESIPFGNNYQLVKIYGWFDNEWGYVSIFMKNLETILASI